MWNFCKLRSPKIIYLSIAILSVIGFSTWRLQNNSKKFEFKLKVPNVVHFALLHDENIIENKNETLDFISATCILSAFFNHQPELIIIHTNQVNFTGKYWEIVSKSLGEKIQLNQVERPTHVFGVAISSIHHATDLIRLKILFSQGGIFLDLDTFIVQPLNEFFDQDFTIGWPKEQNIGTQIILAKPQSRFLQLWIQSYKDYRPSMWYYNAGEAPTKNILAKNPQLVNRIPELFGVQSLAKELYENSSFDTWCEENVDWHD